MKAGNLIDIVALLGNPILSTFGALTGVLSHTSFSTRHDQTTLRTVFPVGAPSEKRRGRVFAGTTP
ncbi:hypothetical protein EV128_12933 [Rhizobium azibense]|nr:hypothetical protein EV128_12933 [Rhizobium azibense]